MRIIITGATGSLGGHLTRYFTEKGHEVIATGRQPKPPAALLRYAAAYLVRDVSQPHELPTADVCIHAAGIADGRADEVTLRSANVLGTKHTAQAAAQCGRFIHISSASIYMPQTGKIREEDAGQQGGPLSLYGQSKWDAEQMLDQHLPHPGYYVLRPRAIYGPGDKIILPRLLQLEKGGRLVCPGPLTTNISLTHLDNVTQAIELCLERKPQPGANVYNITDDAPYILMEIIRQYTQKVYGQKLPERHIPLFLVRMLAQLRLAGLTPLLVRSLTRDMVLDISKAKRELGYQPNMNFAKAGPAILDWMGAIGGKEVLKAGDKSLAWAGF